MLNKNRLDRSNFGDAFLLSELYQKLKNPPDDWMEWEVQPAEEYDMYKISMNAYDTRELWWVISACAKIDNPMERILAGTVIKLPSLAWIRGELKKK